MVGMQACCHEENRFTTRRLRPQVIESRRNVDRPQRSMRRELQNRPVVAPRRCRTVGQLLGRVSKSTTRGPLWRPPQPIQPAHVQALAPQLPASGAGGKPQHFSTCLMGLADICSDDLSEWTLCYIILVGIHSAPGGSMLPALRLRQARERLGFTYRDVERASYELAARRGRPDFILHISRLADIENRGVVPGLHKLYTLAAIYRLNLLELFRWYDVPIEV